MISFNKLFSQEKDTQPPVPYIETSKCCGLVIGKSYVIDEPRDKPNIRSNMGKIVFDKQKSFNFSFSSDDFSPGITDSVAFTLKINDDKFDARAVITFVDNVGNDTTVQIDYFAINLVPDKSIHSFNNVPLNAEQSQTINICNFSKRDFVLSNISLDSLHKDVFQKDDFTIQLVTTDSTIKPNFCFNVKATFRPTKNGFFSVPLVVYDKCGYRQSVVLLKGYSGTLNIEDFDDNKIITSNLHNYLYLDLHKIKNLGNVEIFNVYGNRVITLLGAKDNSRIDISNLSSGVYFIQIGNRVAKFLKY